MTLVREYQPTFVLGDGETKEFSYLFEEVSENFIKVIVKHSDNSTYAPVFSVDLDSHKVVFGESETAPLDTDLVCIYRETPDLQDTPFRTLQGYDARALENILSKIVAMIQELKANGFSTQILQGTPWQLDLLHPADDGASVVIDYNARILKKGLYFQIVSGNLQVSADGSSFITMPKSADITEFRQLETVLEDLTVQYRLQYKVNGVWYNAESNAEATADQALQVAQDAKDIAQAASDKVDGFDDRLTIAEGDASDAKQDASDAKDIAQTASDAVSGHITDTNNPHSVTAVQTGALPNTTKYGADLSLTVDSTTYVVTAQLKDQDGNNLGTAQTIDLPLESVVVSGAYDSATKEVVLTLKDGSTIRFSVADLVSGLQTEITALNMLSADLVDDTSTTHKFVTTTEKTTWNGKQDTISDLATIRSGASAGATAVQPADLATVATTGDYDNLLNKPTIPTTLAGLTGDVDISSPTDGQHLVYVANDGVWKNQSSTASVSWGGITGTLSDQTDLQNALDAKSSYRPDLFDWKWTDHQVNDMQWLRADTFSWQDGTVYSSAYDHLVDDIDGKTLQTETVGGTTISFYLADDGHKICPDTQESNVAAIYTATGVAWYYILDTVNQRFKLPRTQFGVVGYRDGVGNYVAPGLPNLTGTLTQGGLGRGMQSITKSGVFNNSYKSGTGHNASVNESSALVIDFNASLSNSIYGASSTVQAPATQMYLYFYVGEFTQTAIENTAGLNAELFNDKVDLDSSWGAPSGTYDTLTLGASGTEYTAPADGWFSFYSSSVANSNIVSSNGYYGSTVVGASGYANHNLLPVKKGDKVKIYYSASGTARFYYAQKSN